MHQAKHKLEFVCHSLRVLVIQLFFFVIIYILNFILFYRETNFKLNLFVCLCVNFKQTF